MRSRERERSDRAKLSCRPAAVAVGAGLLLTISALTFAAAPLTVAGVGFILLGVLSPAWVALAARSARVRRRLSTTRIIEDEPLEVTVQLRRGLLGLPGAEIADPIADATIAVGEPLSAISGSRRVELRIVTRIKRRGHYTFPPPTMIASDPLRLTRMTKRGSGAPDELLVLPRTERVRWLQGAQQRPTRGQAVRSLQEPVGAGEVDGLRTYRPGSPASRIHWPALARGAGLLERRLISEPHAQPMVVLDAREYRAGHDHELLDAAVRAAASLTLELGRSGGCSVLLPDARLPIEVAGDLASWAGVHTRLALVRGGSDRPPALRAGGFSGPIVYVAARLDQHALPAAASGASSFILVLPSSLGQELGMRPSFEVSGCAGYSLVTRAARGRRRAAVA